MNLEDIARLAGVSRSTVSRAVNNQPRVKPEVRERILQIIKENNFQPNSAARALVQNRTNLIAVVVPEDFATIRVDSWIPDMVAELHRSARARGLAMMFLMEDLATDDDIERILQQVVLSHRIDGIAMLGGVPERLITRLEAIDFPFVVVGTELEPGRPSVDVDNYAGGAAVAEHLWSMGYRSFGLLRAVHSSNAARRRCGGFLDTLAAYGIPERAVPTARTDYSIEDARRACRELLTGPRRPDAIFAQSDWIAHIAIDVIAELGLSVPQDVTIVGFDEFRPDVNERLGLTTVVQPTGMLADVALDSLLSRRSAPILVATCLKVRSSSGAMSPYTIPVGNVQAAAAS